MKPEWLAIAHTIDFGFASMAARLKGPFLLWKMSALRKSSS
jgi:hypothetical protein